MADTNEIPTATHSGEFTLMGIRMRVHRLDDGRAVIEAEDFAAFFNAMEGDCTELDEDELMGFMRFLHGIGP